MDQRVVESEPNCYPRIPVVCRLYYRKNDPPSVPRRKLLFHSLLILFSKLVIFYLVKSFYTFSNTFQ